MIDFLRRSKNCQKQQLQFKRSFIFKCDFNHQLTDIYRTLLALKKFRFVQTSI